MNFLYKDRTVRRYGKPEYKGGLAHVPYQDMVIPMDCQTTDRTASTDVDGTESVQRLKVFCDEKLYVEDTDKQQKADRIWFQGKWFECRSSRLSENTPLRHWTCTFVECLDQEDGPYGETDYEIY